MTVLMKEIVAVIVLPSIRDELKRMICIPDPCCDGDTDVLNIQFAVMEMLTEDAELSPVFRNTLTIELQLKVLNSASGSWQDISPETKVDIPDKTCVKIVLTSPDPIGPIRSLPPRSSGIGRDPRKKPAVPDASVLNKRDPRRKNLPSSNSQTTKPQHTILPTEAQSIEASQHSYYPQKTIQSKTLDNDGSHSKSSVPRPQKVLNKRDPRKKKVEPNVVSTVPAPVPPPSSLSATIAPPSLCLPAPVPTTSSGAATVAPTPVPAPVPPPSFVSATGAPTPVPAPVPPPSNLLTDTGVQLKLSSINPVPKVVSKKDPRLKRKIKENDGDNGTKGESDDQLMDIIRNRSTLSVLAKSADRSKIEEIEGIKEVEIPADLYCIPISGSPDSSPSPPPPLPDYLPPLPPLPIVEEPAPPQPALIPPKEPTPAPLEECEDSDDSDSEGELHIDMTMASQEAKRRASEEEEQNKPVNEQDNIRTEDLLEEMYGSFEKEDTGGEDILSSEASTKKKSDADTDGTSAGDDTPEIMSIDGDENYLESDDEDLVSTEQNKKTCEQLQKEQQMLANLEKERDRLNAIVEDVGGEDGGDDELEEGELSDSDDDNDQVQVCEDESPESPEGDPEIVEIHPEQIPLEREESDEGEASDDEIEIVHERPKEFKKYWEDFDEESGSTATRQIDPMFKRRCDLSPQDKNKNFTVQDASGLFFRRSETSESLPPPPLINPALAAATKQILKTMDHQEENLNEGTEQLSSDISDCEDTKHQDNESDEAVLEPEPSKYEEQTAVKSVSSFSSLPTTSTISLSSLSSMTSLAVSPISQQKVNMLANTRIPNLDSSPCNTSTDKSIPNRASDSEELQIEKPSGIKPLNALKSSIKNRTEGISSKRPSLLGAPPPAKEETKSSWTSEKKKCLPDVPVEKYKPWDNSCPAFQTDFGSSEGSNENKFDKFDSITNALIRKNQSAKSSNFKNVLDTCSRDSPENKKNIPSLMDIDISPTKRSNDMQVKEQNHVGSFKLGNMVDRSRKLSAGIGGSKITADNAVDLKTRLGLASNTKPQSSKIIENDLYYRLKQKEKESMQIGIAMEKLKAKNQTRIHQSWLDGKNLMSSAFRDGSSLQIEPTTFLDSRTVHSQPRKSSDRSASLQPQPRNDDDHNTHLESRKSVDTNLMQSEPRRSLDRGSSRRRSRSKRRSRSRQRSRSRSYDARRRSSGRRSESRKRSRSGSSKGSQSPRKKVSTESKVDRDKIMLMFYEGEDLDLDDPGDPDDLFGKDLKSDHSVEICKKSDNCEDINETKREESPPPEKPKKGLVNFLKQMRQDYNLGEADEGTKNDINEIKDTTTEDTSKTVDCVKTIKKSSVIIDNDWIDKLKLSQEEITKYKELPCIKSYLSANQLEAFRIFCLQAYDTEPEFESHEEDEDGTKLWYTTIIIKGIQIKTFDTGRSRKKISKTIAVRNFLQIIGLLD